MRKLKQPQVNWICREINSGHRSIWQTAAKCGIKPRWARELYLRYLKSGVPPVLQPCGRKAQPVPEKLKNRIVLAHRELPGSALDIEQRLRRKGIKLSHNKIHAVLKQAKLAKREPKKSKPRKWVRYERHKANSLWHSDWKQLYDGKWMLLFEDDATRLTTGSGRFESPTAEVSLQVFKAAVAAWGLPRQLLTDNGTQFCNTHDNRDLTHLFHGTVVRVGCDHIFTRKNHPQCNGKLEKLNHTIERLYKYYGNFSKAVRVYNEKRLHMSLNWRTPLEAWNAKTAKGLKYEKPTKT